MLFRSVSPSDDDDNFQPSEHRHTDVQHRRRVTRTEKTHQKGMHNGPGCAGRFRVVRAQEKIKKEFGGIVGSMKERKRRRPLWERSNEVSGSEMRSSIIKQRKGRRIS